MYIHISSLVFFHLIKSILLTEQITVLKAKNYLNSGIFHAFLHSFIDLLFFDKISKINVI